MIVSFLIPTRGRLQMLLECIQSIKNTASPDVQVEILVRIDEDDHETLAGRDRIPGEIIVGPRWNGYDSVYIFINELAAKSHGDWLVPWNDDIFMTTYHWDKLLPLIDPANRAWIIWFDIPGSWTWALPVMTRKMYELWDCVAPSPPSDAAILNMWKEAGMPIQGQSYKIIVEHRRDEANIKALGLRQEDKVSPPSNRFSSIDGRRLIDILRTVAY